MMAAAFAREIAPTWKRWALPGALQTVQMTLLWVWSQGETRRLQREPEEIARRSRGDHEEITRMPLGDREGIARTSSGTVAGVPRQATGSSVILPCQARGFHACIYSALVRLSVARRRADSAILTRDGQKHDRSRADTVYGTVPSAVGHARAAWARRPRSDRPRLRDVLTLVSRVHCDGQLSLSACAVSLGANSNRLPSDN